MLNITHLYERIKNITCPFSIVFVGTEKTILSSTLQDISHKLIKAYKNKYYDINTYPYIYKIETNNKYKNIHIDELKAAIAMLYYNNKSNLPKILIISLIEDMTESSCNALLKILEEPPSNSYIFLSTLNYKKIKPTISSRCIAVDLRNKFEINYELFKKINDDSKKILHNSKCIDGIIENYLEYSIELIISHILLYIKELSEALFNANKYHLLKKIFSYTDYLYSLKLIIHSRPVFTLNKNLILQDIFYKWSY